MRNARIIVVKTAVKDSDALLLPHVVNATFAAKKMVLLMEGEL